MYIDLHCHLDMLEDIGNVVDNAKKAEVKIILSAGIDPATNRKTLGLSQNYSMIKAALGLYPIDAIAREAGKEQKTDVDAEIRFIKKNSDKISAIGEVGLDYKNGKQGNGQSDVFRKFIELAIELDKPLIVHSRKAEKEAIEILEEYNYGKVVMHCFSGKKKLMLKARDNGWFFTIPTSVVRAQQFQDMVKAVKLSRIFCETDSPFLSPFPDKMNEPAFVVEAYKKIAEIKGLDIEEVKNNIYLNWQKLFL